MMKTKLLKINSRVLAGSSIIFFAILCGQAFAHHSFNAQYDAEKPMTLTGEVTRVEWANPHIYYYVAVTDASGQVAEWAVEGTAPNALFRQGWREDTLKIGDSVTVDGFLARDGSNQLNGRNTTFSDGRQIFSGSNDGAPEY
jgi:hypothetical protein